MARTPITLLLLRRLTLVSQNPKPSSPLSLVLSLEPYSTSTATATTSSSSDHSKPSSLSARMSFVFDQIDAIERERSQKDETLQRIRAWRQSKNTQDSESVSSQNQEIRNQSRNEVLMSGTSGDADSGLGLSDSEVKVKMKREVELVHPWPEWIELMERLVQQNYFDHKRENEDMMVQNLGLDMDGIGEENKDVGIDFKNYKTVQTACVNFGKDRFDIFRSLSRQDIQILVGYGCPSADKKVVFSAKLLRKHVHLDEGDVCSNCSLRSSCERAYLLTNKEDEARTIDVMRVLLAYGFDPLKGSLVNKSLLKQKSVKTTVRKILHQVVKLSAVPIDPNLPPPVIKRPPPKVKQPPPPPKKRIGRDDVEMKKGDWLCPKCDFMNFAKNTVCLQCDAKRPKRQLLPGEWECPECNFLNYRRNMVCFHCDCKRPTDEFMENKMEEKLHGHKRQLENITKRPEVSNAWNFDFDDDESDGADVAAFEYADSAALAEHSPRGNLRGHEDDSGMESRMRRVRGNEYSDSHRSSPVMGFDDFDDVDSYELDTQNDSYAQKPSRNHFSEHRFSESEDVEGFDDNVHSRPRKNSWSKRSSKPVRQKAAFSDSDDDNLDIDSDGELLVHPNWKSSHVADARHNTGGRGLNSRSRGLSFGSDEEVGLHSDADENFGFSKRKGNKRGSGRRNSPSSDWEDGSFSGSEAEDTDRHSRGSWLKNGSGKRGNSFRGHNESRDYGCVRDAEVRSKDKMGSRRNSWQDDFDRTPRGSSGKRGGSQGHQGKNGSFRGNDHSGYRMRHRSDSRNWQQARSSEYNKDQGGDFGEFKNRRRVIER